MLSSNIFRLFRFVVEFGSQSVPRACDGGDSRVAESGQYAGVSGCMGFSEG